MSSHELFEVLIDLYLAVTFSVVEFIQLLGWGEEVLQRSTRVPVSVKLARDDTILASGRQFGRRVGKGLGVDRIRVRVSKKDKG